MENLVLNDLDYSVADSAIAELADSYLSLRIDGIEDREGYAEVHNARMVVKRKRVEIEKKRVELKASALEYGRKVDAEAKRLTALLEPIEQHLIAEQKAVDDEKKRIRREAEEAVIAKCRKLMSVGVVLAEREVAVLSDEAFEAKYREAEKTFLEQQAAKAEEERQRREQQAKLEAEQREIERQRREQQAAAKRLEAERQRLADMERQRIESEERAKAMELAKKEAAERAERETLEREAARKIAEELAARKREEDARRAEAMRPDREKLLTFVDTVERLQLPSVSRDAEGVAGTIRVIIRQCVAELRRTIKTWEA